MTAKLGRTRIKFCGMTSADDIRAAAHLGVDAVGLVFAERSRRRVSLDEAAALREVIPPLVDVVALFMDNPADEVLEVIARLRPSLLQFHGSEDDAFCRAFGVPYMKAIAMGGDWQDLGGALHDAGSAGSVALQPLARPGHVLGGDEMAVFIVHHAFDADAGVILAHLQHHGGDLSGRIPGQEVRTARHAGHDISLDPAIITPEPVQQPLDLQTVARTNIAIDSKHRAPAKSC